MDYEEDKEKEDEEGVSLSDDAFEDEGGDDEDEDTGLDKEEEDEWE